MPEMPAIRAVLVASVPFGERGLTLVEVADFVRAAREAGAALDAFVLGSEYRDGKPECIATLQVTVPNATD